MAKLTRYTQLVFGSSAGLNQLAKFGSLAASSPVRYSGSTVTPSNVQALSNYLTGWFGAVIGTNSPAIEDLNALCYLFAYQLTYLFQAGIPEYDSSTIYYKGSLVQSAGVIYVSLTDSNTGNALTSTSNWAFKDGGVAASSTITVSIYAGGYLVDTSGGNVTANLPAASGATGAMVSFKNKTFGGSNHIAITPNGTDNIEGANAAFNVDAGEFVKLFCDGTAWFLWST